MNYYSLGQLHGEQERTLAPFVKGKVVYDLGAGALGMAHELVRLGAKHVVAVDMEYKSSFNNHLNNMQKWKSGSPKISLHANSFDEFLLKHRSPIRTALVAWPWGHNFGGSGDVPLVALLRHATTIIYLGKNFDGTSCGSRVLFDEFTKREVKAECPHRWNNLIVYGKHSKKLRELLPEERAVYAEEVLWYDDVYGRPEEARAAGG